MTIAISMKVNDGIVLAADSATTIMHRDPSGAMGVINIYHYANKIYNLYKGLPVGAITWGSGGIGLASISTLAKDFRKLITDGDDEWKIFPESYNVKEIAQKFKKFIYDDKFVAAFKDWKTKPSLGFMIVGYSADRPLAEEWKIDIVQGNCNGPYMIRQENQIGMTWNGVPEAISRLFMGFSPGLEKILKEADLRTDQVNKILQACKQKLTAPLVTAPMPIQDAIDLAVFLVKTTIEFSRFAPGAPTVGGPIEVAAITKHEGFKWVRRKHYFDQRLNLTLSKEESK